MSNIVAVPREPVSWEGMLERWPTIRQSLASNYDDCALSAYFSMRYGNGWSTSPQARGTIFHRAAAEILWTMKEQNDQTIPRRVALEILVETCHQRWMRDPEDPASGRRVPLPLSEIVRVPLAQMPELRMSVDKFAKDNQFSTNRIEAIERKLSAPIRYVDANGEMRERIITGTLDCLLYAPPDGAVVLDWKDTWALPPMPKDSETHGYDDEELKGLGYHGYFQQRWYGLLVLANYRNINSVTLREFYPRKTVARKATIHRHQIPDIEEDIGVLISQLDRGLQQGAPNLKPERDGLVDFDALGFWKPQPGRHCFAGSTRFLTDRGVRRLDEACGESVRVLDRFGRWVPGVVESFGMQPMVDVTFGLGGLGLGGRRLSSHEVVVRATPDHRWWQEDGTRLTTMEISRVPLSRGAGLASVEALSPIAGEQEAFCVVVPGSESFTLASGIVTSNCGFCNRPTACPIEEEVRVAAGGAVSERSASTWAARYLVASRIRQMAIDAIKGYVDVGGAPVPVRWAKGRQVLGWYSVKGGGRRFGPFTPEESDRGAHPDLDVQLADAMRAATARARLERGVQPRARGKRRGVK